MIRLLSSQKPQLRTFAAFDKQAQATLVVLDQSATVNVEYKLNSRNGLVGITLLCLFQCASEFFDFTLCLSEFFKVVVRFSRFMLLPEFARFPAPDSDLLAL